MTFRKKDTKDMKQHDQLYLTVVFVSALVIATGCKCPGPEHPQWMYCKSDIGKYEYALILLTQQYNSFEL